MSFLVLETEQVVVFGASLWTATRLDAALGLVVGERKWNRVIVIVNRPDDDGTIRITGRAAGLGTGKAIPKRPAVAGKILITGRVAGSGTAKAIPKFAGACTCPPGP